MKKEVGLSWKKVVLALGILFTFSGILYGARTTYIPDITTKKITSATAVFNTATISGGVAVFSTVTADVGVFNTVSTSAWAAGDIVADTAIFNTMTAGVGVIGTNTVTTETVNTLNVVDVPSSVYSSIKDIYYPDTDLVDQADNVYGSAYYADAVIGAAGGDGTIEFAADEVYDFASNTTFQTGAVIKCNPGAILTPASGVTLTISNIDAGLYQIFDTSAGGTIAFSSGIGVVHPEWWGDNTTPGTTEMGASIRSALAAISATGGIIKLQAQIYYINTYDDSSSISTNEWVCFKIPSNTELSGAAYKATTLKISTTLYATVISDQTASDRISFIGTATGTSGQIIRDLNFDYNNIQITAANGGYSSYNAVKTKGGKVLIERLHIEDAPGRNMIMTTTTATIRDCEIKNGGHNVSQGNPNSTDCSMMYIEGDNNIIEDCTIWNAATAIINVGGVEVHGSNTIVRNNELLNLKTAMNIGNGDSITVSYNNRIENNQMTDCQGGLLVFDLQSDFHITGNYFDNCNDVGRWAIYSSRNDVTGVAGGGIQDKVFITENTFTNDSKIRVAGYQNSIISNNIFHATTDHAIVLLFSDINQENIIIKDNIFVDPAAFTGGYQIGQIALEGSSTFDNVYRDIIIEDNLFISDRDSAAPTDQWAFAATGSAAKTTYTNVIWRNNEVVNLQGAIKVSATTYILGYDIILKNDNTLTETRIDITWPPLAGGETLIDTTSGALANTLGDGQYYGQIKILRMTVDGGDYTLTVTHHETTDPEVFTYDAVGDILVLKWIGTWVTVDNIGVTT